MTEIAVLRSFRKAAVFHFGEEIGGFEKIPRIRKKGVDKCRKVCYSNQAVCERSCFGKTALEKLLKRRKKCLTSEKRSDIIRKLLGKPKGCQVKKQLRKKLKIILDKPKRLC